MRRIAREALELLEPDRAAFIARACEANPDLREQVECLISIGDANATLPLESPYSADGRHKFLLSEGFVLSGRFRIQSVLAKGGMGEVCT